MLSRRARDFVCLQRTIMTSSWLADFVTSRAKSTQALVSTKPVEIPNRIEFPRRFRKFERKPLLVGVNELIRRQRLMNEMKEEGRELVLRPPENGLLVDHLVPVAHEVFAARNELITCVSKVTRSIPIHLCRVCEEVHVGPVPHKIKTCLQKKEHSWGKGGMEHVLPLVESFHLYDRVGRAVSHKECLKVDRIPAIVELCVQAGVDIPDLPTRRRDYPVYDIAGKMFDFEKRFPKTIYVNKHLNPFDAPRRTHKKILKNLKVNKSIDLSGEDLQGYAVRGMEAWSKVRQGLFKLMQKYSVQTCGYCPEVQVGPKGHRVRRCQAFKHQRRDGQHAWQEAIVDNLLPPVFVWHVQDPKGEVPMWNELKSYYGKLPATVELLSQAGAQVGEEYKETMRGDITVPLLEEERWIV